MTREFQVPARVAENVARRHAALTPRRCLYNCRAHARPYPGGSFCDEHAPQPINPCPDPALTLTGLRTAAGLNSDATFLPAHTVIDQKAIDSGKRASGAMRRASHDDTVSSIDQRFDAFHAQNPHVYARLVELVADEVLRGASRIGVGALFERLRYAERTETNGDPYALNNDYRALYVRLLIAEQPEWRDLFETRQRKSA